MERTLAIIKPDAVRAKNAGKIIDRIEQEGFSILAISKLQLTQTQAEAFYAVHKDRGFFSGLVTFMTSGPVIVLALQRDNAVQEWRDLMGETDSLKAAPNTIRRLYGTDKGQNATHGSDSVSSATMEIKFFFPQLG